MESIDFNKKFKIYAEDGFEAFYLLDPSFILKIEKVSAEYDKKMIEANDFTLMNEANEKLCAMARKETINTLNKVLHDASTHMKNGYNRADN